MIYATTQIRVRYDEVDQMGYVYHANHVKYCHIGRTELFRQLNIHDNFLEKNSIMLPVIDMSLNYLKPAKYDELLSIFTSVTEIPKTRFQLKFEIINEKEELICKAKSTLAFVDSKTRKPMKAPEIILQALYNNTKQIV